MVAVSTKYKLFVTATMDTKYRLILMAKVSNQQTLPKPKRCLRLLLQGLVLQVRMLKTFLGSIGWIYKHCSKMMHSMGGI